MDERTRSFLRELERADEEVAATLSELDELSAQVEQVRARAVELEAFLVGLPAERERLREELVQAEARVAGDREEHADAERELAEAEREGDQRRAATSRHRVVRVQDAFHVAKRLLGELSEERQRLEADAKAAAREVEELESRAKLLAEGLAHRPRLAEQAGRPPETGLAGVVAWASGARAALFVARGSLAAERDALIRQANELGALVLGEPFLASSAAAVARRIEQAG